MRPTLIKFVSGDGLTRYEPHDGRNEITRTRLVRKPLRAVSYKENQQNIAGTSFQAQTRVYYLTDRLFDYERGEFTEVFTEE